VLPLAWSMLVERRRWLTAEAFTEVLALCQFVPGGNIINLSVAVGLDFRGVAGAVAALVGLIAAPTTVVIAFGVIYDRYQDIPAIRHIFAGLAAASAGLLIATALKMMAPLLTGGWGVVFAVVCFGAIALLRLPLLPTMLVLAPLSIFVTWWRAA
jgi:chromate transporter